MRRAVRRGAPSRRTVMGSPRCRERVVHTEVGRTREVERAARQADEVAARSRVVGTRGTGVPRWARGTVAAALFLEQRHSARSAFRLSEEREPLTHSKGRPRSVPSPAAQEPPARSTVRSRWAGRGGAATRHCLWARLPRVLHVRPASPPSTAMPSCRATRTLRSREVKAGAWDPLTTVSLAKRARKFEARRTLHTTRVDVKVWRYCPRNCGFFFSANACSAVRRSSLRRQAS